jgi:hypothetical protein
METARCKVIKFDVVYCVASVCDVRPLPGGNPIRGLCCLVRNLLGLTKVKLRGFWTLTNFNSLRLPGDSNWAASMKSQELVGYG